MGTPENIETPGKTETQAVLLAGYRYSGRSLVLQRLELAGYTCVDNLPPKLVPEYLAHGREGGKPHRMAIGLDTYGPKGPSAVMSILDGIQKTGCSCKLVFMEAGDGALRERRAAAEDTDMLWDDQDLQAMRESMAGIRALADLVLDSSYASPLDERDRIIALVEGKPHRVETTVDILTFGYKFGPLQGDVVLDVRFIPNPYYVAALRPLTGLDAPCADYVLGHEGAKGTVQALVSLVGAMLPSYAAQGRSSLRVRIGCTGGRHRSVAVASALAAALVELGLPVNLRHRELDSGRHKKPESSDHRLSS
ncbi:MAG: RNase adapter RapZ [Spirochaetota bacterium]